MLIKKIQADQLEFQVYETRKEMGQASADMGVAYAKEVISKKGFVNIIFAAAPSQFELYDSLLSSDLDFTKVNAFHMDEYLGLAKTAPQRFGNLLNKHLFSKVSLKNIFYIDGSANPESECKRYADLLEQLPPDIIFHGIGENGHLAFNDPPVADFEDPKAVKVVAMDEICRMQQVHDGCFEALDLVPKRAITLTIPTLTNHATKLIVTVPGPTKTDAVKQVFEQPVSTKVPATFLKKHPNAVIVLDREAGKAIL